METTLGKFPFGQPVRKLSQVDQTPKKIFVLGVYASAVHAKWVSPAGKVLINALAVASEPYIFWTGSAAAEASAGLEKTESAEEIISKIKIPSAAGELVAADKKFNGPSGIALDDLILKPLGVKRKDAWLCDLIPYSCMNVGQEAAIKRAYKPLVKSLGLPPPTTAPVPSELADKVRQDEILAELFESKADTLVLLGDLPIKWFLNRFAKQFRALSDFGTGKNEYGRPHPIPIEGKTFQVIPLAHPRQIARLGKSSEKWFRLHEMWVGKGRSK